MEEPTRANRIRPFGLLRVTGELGSLSNEAAGASGAGLAREDFGRCFAIGKVGKGAGDPLAPWASKDGASHCLSALVRRLPIPTSGRGQPFHFERGIIAAVRHLDRA